MKWILMLGLLFVMKEGENWYFTNSYEVLKTKTEYRVHNTHNGKSVFEFPVESVKSVVSTTHPEHYVLHFKQIKAYVK